MRLSKLRVAPAPGAERASVRAFGLKKYCVPFESFLTTAFGLCAIEITTNDRSVRRQKEPIAAPFLGGRTMFNYVVKNGKIDSRLLCVNCRDARLRSNPKMEKCLSGYCPGAETQKSQKWGTGVVL